jgi:hypothetical protein
MHVIRLLVEKMTRHRSRIILNRKVLHNRIFKLKHCRVHLDVLIQREVALPIRRQEWYSIDSHSPSLFKEQPEHANQDR